MTWLSNHAFELLLVAGYLAVLAWHARAGSRHVRGLDDYLVAGRRMGGVVIGLSFYATFMSTNTFIGAAGKSWSHGLSWCVGGVVLTSLACVSWFVVAPRFVPLTREYNSLTVPDFLGTHYQSRLVRQIAAVIVAFSSVIYLVAIYRGASLALESFLGLRYVWCVLAVMVVVTLYTLFGGFESVVLTDALQGVLMIVGAVAILFALIKAGGGIGSIFDSLRQQDPKLASFSNGPALAAALAYSLSVGVKYLVEPRQLSRFYGLRDAKSLRIASVIAPIAIFVTYVCLLPVGAMARTVLSETEMAAADTDQVVPLLLGQAQILGPIMGTLFLLVLVSAAMSSIDSVLLVAASTIDRDLKARPAVADGENHAKAVMRTRLWVIVVSAAAATSALLPFTHDIVDMTAFSGSLYGACFLPVLVVGLFVRRRSSRAATFTMIVGAICVVTAFVLKRNGISLVEGIAPVHEVYPGILLGMLTYGLLHFWNLKRRGEAPNRS